MAEKSTGKPDLTDKWTESKNDLIMAWKRVRSFNISPFTIRTSLISQGGLVVEIRVINAHRHSGVGLHNNQFTTQAFARRRNNTYAPLHALVLRKSHALFEIKIHLQVLILRGVW